jgi:hypothetical protein
VGGAADARHWPKCDKVYSEKAVSQAIGWQSVGILLRDRGIGKYKENPFEGCTLGHPLCNLIGMPSVPAMKSQETGSHLEGLTYHLYMV